MDSAVAQKLVELNRRFYADFGENFSATRQRIQPGVREVILELAGNERILDLGCGNGELARTLAQTGFHGAYLGLDFSPPLLKDAETQPGAFPVNFRAVDLTGDWGAVIVSERWLSSPLPVERSETGAYRDQASEAISASSQRLPHRQRTAARNDTFDLITSFATLHHIPSQALRLNIFRQVHGLLAPGGRFIHSNWQFLNSEKLKARIQPWETVSLSAAEVDEGDYLLDWRAGGQGLRYVHHFSEAELGQLAAETGFRVVESFLSDGENGRLGLYQVWETV